MEAWRSPRVGDPFFYSPEEEASSHSASASTVTPMDYVDRFCNVLRLQPAVVHVVLEVAKYVYRLRMIPDNGSTSITAAVIYLVVEYKKLPYTKEDIKRASDMSEVTIGKCYNKLVAFKPALYKYIETVESRASDRNRAE